MQSSSFTLSHSISLPKLRKPSIPTPLYGFNPISLPSSSKSLNFASINGRRLPSVSCSSSSSSSPLPPPVSGWISPPSLLPQRESHGFQVRATSVPESADESAAKSKALKDTLVLGSLFGLWYLFNIYFNIYNKQVRVRLGLILFNPLLFSVLLLIIYS